MSTDTAAQLRSIVERVERLAEERQTIADDIADVYREAKGAGFDVKVIKRVIALRRQGKAEREEFDAILDVYLAALGMIPTFEPEAPRVHVHENPFSVPAAPFPSPGERRPVAETVSSVSAATFSRLAPEAREMEIV
mgnify:FL=1